MTRLLGFFRKIATVANGFTLSAHFTVCNPVVCILIPAQLRPWVIGHLWLVIGVSTVGANLTTLPREV